MGADQPEPSGSLPSGSLPKSYVSSSGVAFSNDEEQDRKWVQMRTPFVCSCKYPALATWKFCPH